MFKAIGWNGPKDIFLSVSHFVNVSQSHSFLGTIFLGGACSKKRLEGLLGVPEGDHSALLSL